ncbi:hypothetical protein G7Y79_00042g078160 [Physcia stellaris]|nr:hypothetical protein G7Y79_00042g078160 [Physcia stellaris]
MGMERRVPGRWYPNRVKAKPGAIGQTPVQTPGGSVNHSITNSINGVGGKTPSPDHGQGKDVQGGEGPAEVQQVSIRGHSGAFIHLIPTKSISSVWRSCQCSGFQKGDVYLMGGLVNGTTVKGDLWMIEAGVATLACYPVGTTYEGPGPVSATPVCSLECLYRFGGDTKMDDRDKLDDTLYLLNTCSKIYVFGGQVEGYFFNDLNLLSISMLFKPPIVGGKYSLKIQMTEDRQRAGHSAALVGDVMYIFGGRTEEGADLGDLAAFRITSRRWYTFQNMGPSPSPRSGHSMTAFGKQIVVLAGEPSSAPRDAGELSLVYMLDTAKIRYPNDQQIQQTPTGERVPGNRRPSAERQAPQLRGPIPRDGARSAWEAVQGMGPRGPDMKYDERPPHGMPHGPPPQGPPPGPGSRMARSAAQSPGPPPLQQAPQPRPNGVAPVMGAGSAGSRSRTPTRDARSPYGQQIDTSRTESYEKEHGSPVVSPISGESPRGALNNRSVSPILNGRRTPTAQQPQKMMNPMVDPEEAQIMDAGGVRSRSRQAAPEDSYEEIQNFPTPSQQPPREPSPFDDGADETPPSRNYMRQESRNQESRNQESRNIVRQDIPDPEEMRQHQQLEELANQQEALIGELETARTRNAWFLSRNWLLPEKLAISRMSLKIHFLSMTKLDLLMLGVNAAAQEVAAIEQQRDVAIREAAYAKAKLAAHGGAGSVANTPQSEGVRDMESEDRSSDIGQLAVALATQNELRATIQAMTAEIQSEKQARELAEGTAEVAQKRVADFEQSYNPGELESLRRELHETSKAARDHATQKTEAHSRAELLEVDKNDLSRRLDEALENANQHSVTFASLHEAVTSSNDKTSLLERKLEEERGPRENLEQKLLQLRAEHEERTAELDATSRRLRDAEELAENHANEARTHRTAVLSGLETLKMRSPDTRSDPMAEERVVLLKQQVENAHNLLRQHQTEADTAAEKLRGAEERIAGLEAYQEQASPLQSKHNDILQHFESHQRDTSALTVQHNALKELLDERGASRASRRDTPEQNRLKDIEQQLEDSLRAHEETRSTAETRMQEADQGYREKLEQLEADYQSAVHYVKGTEKMLKRMKDELQKYKGENRDLRKELDSAHSRSERSLDPEAAAEWEQERQQLRREIDEMQESVKDTVFQLERQMEGVQSELYEAQRQRDFYRHNNDQAQQQMSQLQHQARSELDQLKSENSMLESRAMDAEQKVTLLLDQVGNSVTNYRRQSQQMMTNGHAHSRNQSSISTRAHDSTSTDATFNLGASPPPAIPSSTPPPTTATPSL